METNDVTGMSIFECLVGKGDEHMILASSAVKNIFPRGHELITVIGNLLRFRVVKPEDMIPLSTDIENLFNKIEAAIRPYDFMGDLSVVIKDACEIYCKLNYDHKDGFHLGSGIKTMDERIDILSNNITKVVESRSQLIFIRESNHRILKG